MPNALTSLLAIGSAALALSFFAVLLHVARTQQPPAPPSTALPSLRNASRAAAAKCSAHPTPELCAAAPQRCGWQAEARACVRSLPAKPSRRASKGGGGKNKGAAQEEPAAAGAFASAACEALPEAQCTEAGRPCSFDRAARACVPKSKRRGRGGGRLPAVPQKT